MNLKIVSSSLLLLCTWLISQEMMAQQQATIRGRITAAGNPVAYVNVGIPSLSIGEVTDENGFFEIVNKAYGRHTVRVSCVGFSPQQNVVELSVDHPVVRLNFELQETSEELDEVVISGTMKEVSKLESPVSVEVYTSKFFKANPAPSIFESMQNVNGVRPQVNCNVCNTGDIHINGLEGPYTMVLIDGMPLVSGLSTVYGLIGIPQSLIERIEVVKGPASTLYGSEAVGGLINVITKSPLSAPVVSSDIFGTSWGEINTDIGVRYNLSGQTHGLLGINYFNYQNPIDNNNDNFTDVTLQNRISVFNKLNFKRKDNRVFSLAGRYVYEDRWGGEMDWSRAYRGGTEIYGESIYTSRWETFGIYQLPVKELINFQFSGNGHHQNSVYGDTRYLAEQYVGFGQLTWNKPLQKHDIMTGLAYRYTWYDDNTPATATPSQSNAPAMTHLPGLFVQDEIIWNENNKLLLGVRYDHNSLHGSILSPRFNYKWNAPNKQTIIRLSAGNGYRVANVFTEDHAALTGAREVIFEEELKPETSWNTNLNIVQKIYTGGNGYIGLDASAFYTHFSNAIIPDYETDPDKIIYGNLNGSAISKGVSLNLELSWASGLNIITGATLMDVSVTEAGETFRQLLTERFTGVWSVGYTFPGIGLTVDYTGNVYSPMRLPLLGDFDDRPEYSSWYSIQNIQFTKQFNEQWELYGGLKNLLNFTPPANSIARAFDPFDEGVDYDENGQVKPTEDKNPNALTFDPSYVYAPNQGIRGFLGVRYVLFSK